MNERRSPLATRPLAGGDEPVLGGGAKPARKSAKPMGMAVDEDDEELFAVRCSSLVDALEADQRRSSHPPTSG